MDPAGDYWADAELLAEIDSGCRAVCARKNDAFSKTVATALVAGALQSVPSDGYQILDVISDSAGAQIHQVERRLLTHQIPAWQSAAAVSTGFSRWMLDPRSKKNFFIYPPAIVSASVTIFYHSVPPAYTSLAAAIPLDDIYEDAIYWWALAQAWANNTKRGDVTKANSCMGNFNAVLGLQNQSQNTNIPTSETLVADNQRGVPSAR